MASRTKSVRTKLMNAWTTLCFFRPPDFCDRDSMWLEVLDLPPAPSVPGRRRMWPLAPWLLVGVSHGRGPSWSRECGQLPSGQTTVDWLLSLLKPCPIRQPPHTFLFTILASALCSALWGPRGWKASPLLGALFLNVFP